MHGTPSRRRGTEGRVLIKTYPSMLNLLKILYLIYLECECARMHMCAWMLTPSYAVLRMWKSENSL